jgi:hypothetical protein
MQRWFRADGERWWLDAAPPPPYDSDETDYVELVFSSAAEAEARVSRLLVSGLNPPLLHEVFADAGVSHPERLTAATRLRTLGHLLDGQRLRLWRERRLSTHSTWTGWGGSTAASSIAGQRSHAPPPPSAARSSASSAAGASVAGRAPSPTAADPRLSWYEFILLDELDEGLPDVQVQMTTPKGVQWAVTSASGSIRVEAAPPGRGSAAIDMDSLTLALESRAGRPRRTTKPPEPADDFKVVTPSRIRGRFSFPDAQPHRVMVVSRTDLHVAGADPKWAELTLHDDSRLPTRYSVGSLHEVSLCSRGKDESGVITGDHPACPDPAGDADAALQRAADGPRYQVRPGDSLWGIAERFMGSGVRWEELREANLDVLAGRPPDLIHPGDQLRIPLQVDLDLLPTPEAWSGEMVTAPPAFLETAIDPLHEGLFDAKGDNLSDQLAQPLIRLRAPSPPPAEPPILAAQAFAAHAAFVAVELDSSILDLINPVERPEFDPIEQEGPPKRVRVG